MIACNSALLDTPCSPIPARSKPGLNITIARLFGDQGYCLRLLGRVGMAEVDMLKAHLDRLLSFRPGLVVVDLAELQMLSSLGMGALLALRRDLYRHGGQVKLAAPRPLVLSALKLTGLAELFEICPSVKAALGQSA